MTKINDNVARFIFGGNAIFTIKKDNKCHAYKVYRKRTDDNSKIYCVLLRSGNKNIYCGYFKICGNVLRYNHNFQKNKIPRDDERVFILLDTIHNRKNLENHGIEIYHNGRCGHCGRILTDLKSINRGFGPDCWKLMKNFV